MGHRVGSTIMEGDEESSLDGEAREGSESSRHSVGVVEEFGVFTEGAVEADESDVGSDE